MKCIQDVQVSAQNCSSSLEYKHFGKTWVSWLFSEPHVYNFKKKKTVACYQSRKLGVMCNFLFFNYTGIKIAE